MTIDQAEATSLITKIGTPAAGCDSSGRLVAAPPVASEIDESGRLFFSTRLGLAAIYAYAGIATPEGIHLGSTYADVHAAFPTWTGMDGHNGRGLVPVPGNSDARYRIDIEKGAVAELDIQLTKQDCYE
jgi:hypothetical protein